MLEDLCEQLKQLRLQSHRLFPKFYRLVKGLCPEKHKPAVKFINTHRELVSKITKKFPEHPNFVAWERVDKYARLTLQHNSKGIVDVLESEYALLEDMTIFQDQVLRLLGDLNQRIVNVSVEDGRNEVVNDWMNLFSEVVAMHLLADRVPRKAIIQVYTAAYMHIHRVDPPHRQQICNFVLAFSGNIIGQLQVELSHYSARLRQVIEDVVSPVLSRLPSSLEMCQRGMFHPQYEGSDRDFMLNEFVLMLPDMRKWVAFGCLVCPVILRSPPVRECLATCLSNTFKIHIFHEQCEPWHVTFSAHIKPQLDEHYRVLAKSTRDKEKKLELKLRIKDLVDNSKHTADAECWLKRKQSRIALVRDLKRVILQGKTAPRDLPVLLTTSLHLLSLSKEEIMWYFQEVGGIESVSDLPVFAATPGSLPKVMGREADPTVIALVDCHVQLQLLLLSYRTFICREWISDIKNELRFHIIPVVDSHFPALEAAGKLPPFVSHQIQQLIELISTLPDLEHGVDGPDGTANSFWRWDGAAEFVDIWHCICMSLVDRHSPLCLRQEKAYMELSDFIAMLKMVVLKCTIVGNFIESVAETSSLQELCYFRPQIQSVVRHSLDTPDINQFNVLCFLHVFGQFLRNDPGSSDPFRPQPTNSFIGFAEQASTDLINMVIEKIKKMIVNCLSAKGGGDQHLAEEFNKHYRQLSSLVASVSSIGCVPVTPRLRFKAEVYLVDAVCGTFRAVLTRQAFSGTMMQLPTVLEREHSNFLIIINCLQSYAPFDLVSPLHRVRATLIGDTNPMNQTGTPLVPSIAEWYVSHIIRDVRNFNVVFWPGTREFLCLSGGEEGSKVALCSRLAELRALVSVFGTEGVRHMEEQWRGIVRVCLSQIHQGLKANCEVLKSMDVDKARRSPDSYLDLSSAHRPSNKIHNLKEMVECIQKLTRGLALRQLLSEAYSSVLDDRTEGMCRDQDVNGHSILVDADLKVGLPEPGYGPDDSPSSADPAVVEALSDLVDDRSDNWSLLPVLLACTLTTLTWTIAPFNSTGRAFLNGMHHLTFCLKSLALALEEMSEAGADMEALSAQGLLEHFARVAATLVMSRTEPASVMNARYLLMDTLSCRQLSRERLEQLGFPMSRLRSAQYRSPICPGGGKGSD